MILGVDLQAVGGHCNASLICSGAELTVIKEL